MCVLKLGKDHLTKLTHQSFLHAPLWGPNLRARSHWTLCHPGWGPSLRFTTLSDSFSSSKLLTITREWHRWHHLPNERQSGLVTPRCSQAGNRTSSHHSYTSTHYTVKQKYLYFPGWLWWFLMPLTLNHVLLYYLRNTPNSCWAGSITWHGFTSATTHALMGTLVCLWCLGKACHGHCGPRLFFYVFVSNEFKTGPKSPCHCAGDLKKAGLLPQVSTEETWPYITKSSLQLTASFVCLEVRLECRHMALKSPSRDHQQCCRKEISFPVPITQLWAFLC